MVIHWADLVPVFFDTYRNILYRSDISGQDAQSDATFLWLTLPADRKKHAGDESGLGVLS